MYIHRHNGKENGNYYNGVIESEKKNTVLINTTGHEPCRELQVQRCVMTRI